MLDVKEEIYKTVENIVQRYYQDQKTSPQYSAVVVEPSRDKYIVLVNGSKYLVRDGVGISPAPNTPVYICVPNNDWNQAYICAGKADGLGTIRDVYQNGSSVLGTDRIARVVCATPEDIQQLQENFQDGVDSIYDACVTKGSTPESHSLSDVVQGILDIEGQGTLIEKSITHNGTYNAVDDNADGYNIVTVNCPSSIDYYGEVEPQYIDTDPILDGDGYIKVLEVYYELEEQTRPRFFTTLNFVVSNIESTATVSIYYYFDSSSSREIIQTYTDEGSKVLSLNYLLPSQNPGFHIFSMYIRIVGGDIS